MPKQKYNWEKLKNEYITGNLTPDGSGVRLKELAQKHSIPKSVLWNRARKEGWGKELKEAKKVKNKELSIQVQKAVVDIDKADLMEEYKVRSENYKTATKLLGKLLKRWESLTEEEIKEMSASDLVKGMLACLKARAQAAGLPDVFKVDNSININIRQGEVSVEESTLRQAKYTELADKLFHYLNKKNEEIIDV